MMLTRFLLPMMLLTSTAMAQDATPVLSPQQRIESILGQLMVQNAELSTRVEVLTKQVADLSKQVPPKEAEPKSSK